MSHPEPTDHDRAVQQVAREFNDDVEGVEEVYARNVSGFDDPPATFGTEDVAPDVQVTYEGGGERFVEITSGDTTEDNHARRAEAIADTLDADPTAGEFEQRSVDEVLGGE